MSKLRRGLAPLVLLSVWVYVAAQTSNHRYPVVANGKLGFIDSQGMEVIPLQFEPIADMAHFEDGLAPVIGPDGAGYIDLTGRFVIGPQHDWGQPRAFREGFAGVLIWNRNGGDNRPALIDQTGRVVLSDPYREGDFFSEGLMPLSKDNRWGFVDKSFRWMIRPAYARAEEFSEGLAPVQVGRKWGFIGRSGNMVVRPKYDLVWRFSNGLARVRVNLPPERSPATVEGEHSNCHCMYGFVDSNGVEAIRPQFGNATNFLEDRAFATLPGTKLLSIIDRQGNALTEAAYQGAGEFHEGLAAASVSGVWGYVDREGFWTIAPRFSRADDFRHGLARVAWEGGRGYIDKAGKIVWMFLTNTGRPSRP